MRLRVIALGSPHGGDDEVMLGIAGALAGAGPEGHEGIEVIVAGRPGPGLLDLLEGDAPVLLLDVVRSGAAAGTIHELPLAALAGAGIAADAVSSHGLGPAEALRLGAALGRPLPPGRFVGVEGERFTIGGPPSPAVAAALPALRERIRAAIAALDGPTPRGDGDNDNDNHDHDHEEEPCTSPG